MVCLPAPQEANGDVGKRQLGWNLETPLLETLSLLLLGPSVMRLSSLFVLAICVCVAAVPQATGAVVFDEASFGDFSDDNTDPTNLGFFVAGAGGSNMANTVLGQTDSGAADIFTFEIAVGNQLNSLVLSQYEQGDAAMFVAISTGEEFPSSYEEINEADFGDTSAWLGGSTIGLGDIGNDVLPRMGRIGIGSGYVPPLGAGKYTFYIQQTGPLTDYGLDFNVSAVSAVPEPSTSLALCAMAVTGFGYRRRRRKRQAST